MNMKEKKKEKKCIKKLSSITLSKKRKSND